MSRRKQKFPAHLSGEGEESDHCQEDEEAEEEELHQEHLSSSVEFCSLSESDEIAEANEMDLLIDISSDQPKHRPSSAMDSEEQQTKHSAAKTEGEEHPEHSAMKTEREEPKHSAMKTEGEEPEHSAMKTEEELPVVPSDTTEHTENSDYVPHCQQNSENLYDHSSREHTEYLEDDLHRQENSENLNTSSSDDCTLLPDVADREPSERLLIVEEPITCSSPAATSEGLCPGGVNYAVTLDSQIISANSLSAKTRAYKREGSTSAISSMFSEVCVTSGSRNSSKHVNGHRKIDASERIKINDFKCPVCNENFKSKRSFNSHILVHCQLVNTRASMKRSLDEASCSSMEKRKNQTEFFIKTEQSDPHFPLDLSCKRNYHSDVLSSFAPEFFKRENLKDSFPPEFLKDVSLKGSFSPDDLKNLGLRGSFSPEFLKNVGLKGSFSPEFLKDSFSPDDLKDVGLNNSFLSDRSPTEDENENLVNEAREHEKAFFDNLQNEFFLTEDSTGFEAPAPLPMFHSGGVTRRVRVSTDEGPPMVYRIKTHAEQIFISRILGTNEETGDKIELYKCFMCNLSFPSISKMQVHLAHHKQRFVCCKCNYSCESRVDFSHHVQKKHITSANKSRYCPRSRSDSGEDSTNAENTVTVAALLSALHGNSVDRKIVPEDGRLQAKTEEDNRQDDLFPSSPSSETPTEDISGGMGGGTSGDLFKMFSCRFCGKKFDRAFSCNRHERVHTGFKPCFCRICGRGFSEPRNLRHHVIRFHSDGSLRHLIKRDRRKRKGEESPPHMSDSAGLLHKDINEISFMQRNSAALVSPDHKSGEDRLMSNGLVLQQSNANHYTNNLTKIFAASLDQSNLLKGVENLQTPISINGGVGGGLLGLSQTAMFPMADDSLEPGEIRLNLQTRILDDENRSRRLVVNDDLSGDDSDHSPQFSSYAPRLNIVQDPVQRTKALVPTTDDIGRTFYECSYCPKLFGSTSDLNRHLDFHEDLRPYECGYCDYSARTNSQLKVHKMRHEGIKQFSCEICNYNGVTQSDLNRHKKTQSHIARSQNICRMCGLGFYSNSQKQVHIVKCHPEMEGASSLIEMSLGIPRVDLSPPAVEDNVASSSSLPASASHLNHMSTSEYTNPPSTTAVSSN